MDENRITKNGNYLNLKLTKSESLILFEFLSRFNKAEREELFEDQAEQRVLWDLECILEKQLSEPFRKDYKKLVEKARDEVRDKVE